MIHIEQLDVSGYRHLQGRFELGPGLNVVTGPNESGKSTLHEALTVALFGFGPDERRRSRGRSSAKELRRPWGGPPFGCVLTLVGLQGDRLRVRWDFESDVVEVTHAVTGDEVLYEQPQQRQDYTVGPLLLGLSRDDHRQLSCLFQDGLKPVLPTETMRQSLQHAVERTAGDDGGVEEAGQRLKALLSRLGVHAGHYKPTANGHLARALDRVDELERRLEDTTRERAALEDLVRRRIDRERELASIGERIVDREQVDLRLRAEGLADEHTRAVQLAHTATTPEDAPAAALASGLDGRVAAARERADVLRRALDEARRQEASSAERLETARAAARDAEAVRDRLDAYADVDTAGEEAVRAALGRLRAAAPSVTPPEAPSPRDPVLARFREARAALTATEPATSAAPASKPLLVAAAAFAAVGLGAGVVVNPAALALVLVAALLAVIALRHRGTAAPAAPVTFEGRQVADLAREADEEDRTWMRHEATVAEHERIVAESSVARQRAETQLRSLLHTEASDSALEELADDLLRRCAKHREHLDADRLAERAGTELRTAAEPADTRRRAEQELAESEADLRRLLARAGIDDDDLALALRSFEALVTADATRREEAKERDDAAGRLEELLDGRTMEDVAAAVEAARRDLATHVAAHGQRTDAPVAGTTIADDAARRDELIAELADLKARIHERESGMDYPADLELQLDEARDELARTERQRDAARMAREELDEAAREAHSRVAPHLNAALARTLPGITRGRYRDAMVGDDLSIRVVVPGVGKTVDVERLSRGTRDQIALIQRLELARLLDPSGGGTPLLLDDCFAHTDEHRLPLAIELLAEVAAGRQVVLFTDDRDVVDAVVSSDGTATVVELPDPVTISTLDAA